MALATPEASLGTGLAVAALTYGIFQHQLPSMADIHTCESGNQTIHTTAKGAAWTSAAVVAGTSLIAKDPTIFVLGGAMTLALYWLAQHANHVSPMTGKLDTSGVSVESIVSAQGGQAQTQAYDAVI